MGAQDVEKEPFDNYRYAFELTKTLDKISRLLRTLGILTLFLTLCNLGLLIGQVINSALIAQDNQVNRINASSEGYTFYQSYLSYWWLVGTLATFAVTLITLGAFDLMRRRGDAIFQEVSNRFQEIEKEQSPESREMQSELMPQARISLRSFASSADPPLIRGRYGTAIYALVNIVVVLIAVILYAQVA
jgi:hypothetical protein